MKPQDQIECEVEELKRNRSKLISAVRSTDLEYLDSVNIPRNLDRAKEIISTLDDKIEALEWVLTDNPKFK